MWQFNTGPPTAPQSIQIMFRVRASLSSALLTRSSLWRLKAVLFGPGSPQASHQLSLFTFATLGKQKLVWFRLASFIFLANYPSDLLAFDNCTWTTCINIWYVRVSVLLAMFPTEPNMSLMFVKWWRGWCYFKLIDKSFFCTLWHSVSTSCFTCFLSNEGNVRLQMM